MKKENKTTTLSGQITVSRTETGTDYVQVLPDNPCVGQVESFRGLGYGQMLSTGSFEFTRHKIPRSQAITLLKLPHSSVSECKDRTVRFTYIVNENDLEGFSRWLLEEAPQAAAFMSKQLKNKKKTRK